MKTQVYEKSTPDENQLLTDAAKAAMDAIGPKCAGIVFHVLWSIPGKDEFGNEFSCSTAMGISPKGTDTERSNVLRTLLEEIPDHAREWAARTSEKFGI